MKVRQLIDEDCVNYKKISMFIGFSTCTWKCEKECGKHGMCQNLPLASAPEIDVPNKTLIQRYLTNGFSEAVVIGGLEPFDSFDELLQFIKDFREVSADNICVYTGYDKMEVESRVQQLSQFENIIIKFGRYKPNQEKHFDPVLGVYLASDNQYAEKIS